jgi:hypothetical protein
VFYQPQSYTSLLLASQMSALKSQLAASEHLVSEQQRREAEARAEINMLTSAMAALKQQQIEVRVGL